jgi:hypothetical protein
MYLIYCIVKINQQADATHVFVLRIYYCNLFLNNLHYNKLKMKKIIAVLSFAFFFFSSCKKENTTPSSANEALPASVTILASGNFIGSIHSTSGTAKVVKDSANRLYLVIENFRTAAGPDLRTWVSPDNTGNPYQDLGLLKAASGHFFYELDASFNYKTNSHVLIWCRQYSVLFGYAVLQ